MAGSMKHPCQALIVRYAPEPASGEMLNVGVVLLSPGHNFMGSRFLDKWARLTQAFPEADIVHLRRVASAIERTCEKHFSIQLPLERPTEEVVAAFNAALPPDDASIIHSAPLKGITADPVRTLNELFERYVAVRDAAEQRVRRADADVWRTMSNLLKAKNVLHRLQEHTVRGRRYEERFDYAWKNGRWNVAKPLSLDLLDPHEIRTKAASWCGRIAALDPDPAEAVDVHVLVGMPAADAPVEVRGAAEDGLGILKEQLEGQERASIVPEGDAETFAERIATDILGHEAAE